MNDIFLIAICIIPSLLILTYIYIKDKIEKEPFYLLLILFIGGIIASIISFSFSILLKKHIQFLNWSYNEMNLLQIIFKILITIALIEEVSKWIINYIITWKNRNFNHVYDQIVYCSFIALGFASFENIIYGTFYSQYGTISLIMRGLISVPSHAVFGIFMGYYLGISKNSIIYGKIKQSKKYKLLSIITPTFLHFIYNIFLIKPNDVIYIIFMFYILLLYIFAYNKIKKLSSINKTWK